MIEITTIGFALGATLIAALIGGAYWQPSFGNGSLPDRKRETRRKIESDPTGLGSLNKVTIDMKDLSLKEIDNLSEALEGTHYARAVNEYRNQRACIEFNQQAKQERLKKALVSELETRLDGFDPGALSPEALERILKEVKK